MRIPGSLASDDRLIGASLVSGAASEEMRRSLTTKQAAAEAFFNQTATEAQLPETGCKTSCQATSFMSTKSLFLAVATLLGRIRNHDLGGRKKLNAWV